MRAKIWGQAVKVLARQRVRWRDKRLATSLAIPSHLASTFQHIPSSYAASGLDITASYQVPEFFCSTLNPFLNPPFAMLRSKLHLPRYRSSTPLKAVPKSLERWSRPYAKNAIITPESKSELQGACRVACRVGFLWCICTRASASASVEVGGSEEILTGTHIPLARISSLLKGTSCLGNRHSLDGQKIKALCQRDTRSPKYQTSGFWVSET